MLMVVLLSAAGCQDTSGAEYPIGGAGGGGGGGGEKADAAVAKPDAKEFKDASPTSLSCVSCNPIVTGTPPSCSETLTLNVVCGDNNAPGDSLVTVQDASGDKLPVTQTLTCGNNFLVFANPCAVYDAVEVSVNAYSTTYTCSHTEAVNCD